MKHFIIAVAIVAAGVANSAPVKSAVAEKQTNIVLVGDTGNPYITDGLVAMWDGIWNAGVGLHDPNATVWKDLVGDADFDFSTATGSGSIEIEDNAIVKTDVINPASGAKGCIIADPSSWTIEAAMQFLRGEEVNSTTGIGTPQFFLGNSGIFYMGFNIFVGNTYVFRTHYKTLITNYYNNPTSYGTGTFSVGQTDFAASASLEGIKKVAQVYRNGVEAAIEAGGWTGNVSSFPYAVKALYTGSNNSKGKQRIFCIRLYNRALTPAEIAHNYKIDKARFNLP